MRVVLDQNFPVPVARALSGHRCDDAYSLGWAMLANGELLTAAEAAGFEVMLTADRSIRYQQALVGRRIALVVTSLNNQAALLQHIDLIQAAVDRATPGGYEEVTIPAPVLRRRPWPRPEP